MDKDAQLISIENSFEEVEMGYLIHTAEKITNLNGGNLVTLGSTYFKSVKENSSKF